MLRIAGKYGDAAMKVGGERPGEGCETEGLRQSTWPKGQAILGGARSTSVQVADANDSALSKRGIDGAEVVLQDPVVETASNLLAPRPSRGIGHLKHPIACCHSPRQAMRRGRHDIDRIGNGPLGFFQIFRIAALWLFRLKSAHWSERRVLHAPNGVVHRQNRSLLLSATGKQQCK